MTYSMCFRQSSCKHVRMLFVRHGMSQFGLSVCFGDFGWTVQGQRVAIDLTSICSVRRMKLLNESQNMTIPDEGSSIVRSQGLSGQCDRE